MTESELAGINIGEKPIFIKHASLERLSDNSQYRSLCPVCKIGVLLVRRDPVTFELCQEDYCILCCQHIIYTDIGEQKVVEPKKPIRKIII
jgi:hypothetical protein